jgi:ketosteroid isomerase-like protein
MIRRSGTAILLAVALIMIAAPASADDKAQAEVRKVVVEFEQALKDRNLAKIETLVADDLVALENGHRNNGWADFRDNHLVPEMKEPMPPSRSEVIKVVATPQMGWGYTRTDMTLTRKDGSKAQALLWSVYVLERRGTAWKIALLDWSLRVQR